MDRREAVFLLEALRRHVPRCCLSQAGGDQLYLCVVRHELQAVFVAGDDDAIPAVRFAFAGDCADQVVRLIAREFVTWDVHSVKRFFEQGELLRQLLGHSLSLRFIGVIFQMPERRLTPVKGDAERVRLLFIRQALHGRQKAVNRVGIKALTRCQRTNAVIGAVQD